MRKVIVLVSLVLLLSGCTKGCQQEFKHFQSDTVGLSRKVTLYAYDGSVIREWEGRYNIETGEGGYCRFIDKGKTVHISGTYIIEEK